jgi:hypothetical protein
MAQTIHMIDWNEIDRWALGDWQFTQLLRHMLRLEAAQRCGMCSGGGCSHEAARILLALIRLGAPRRESIESTQPPRRLDTRTSWLARALVRILTRDS